MDSVSPIQNFSVIMVYILIGSCSSSIEKQGKDLKSGEGNSEWQTTDNY
jgi:hypothetical protein